MGGAHGDEHLLRRNGMTPAGFVVRYSLSQGSGALIWGVVGLTGGEGCTGRGLDGLRCIEIRFSDG